MKRLILLIALMVFAHSGMTQSPDSTLEQRILTAMSQLSYDSLVTGIHIDRVPQYLPVKAFDGTWPSDSVEVSWQALSLLYSMLAWCQVDSFPLPLMDSTLSAEWHKWDDHDTLLIGGLWMRYDRFKPWAIDSNLVTWDSSYFHTVPSAASPFEQDVVFALSMADDVRYGLTQVLHFDPDWFFTNQPGGWNTLEMDAGDGQGWRSVTPGDVLTIQYGQEGLRYLDFRMITSTGDTLICTASMDVRAENSLHDNQTRGFGDEPDDIINLGDISTWRVWESYRDKCGNEQWRQINRDLPAGLTAYIFYNKECETAALRKPLFLVNGFDPARSHGWEFVMGEDGLLLDDYNDVESKLLSDHLHDEQFDIIYVTFSDATGDIRTNAGWLRQLIEQVNGMKAAAGSEEKNVVIGASMGGLVSKWALLTMQNDDVDHETELFMTVDSPLRGAHIPLGLQAMVKDLEKTSLAGKDLKDINTALRFNKESLNSVGARQMLYYNWMTVNNRATNGSSLSDEHNSFFTEFDALGTLQIPHIAVSNGAINGGGNAIIPGEKLLDDGNVGDWLSAVSKSCSHNLVGLLIGGYYMGLNVWASPGYSGIVGLEGHKSDVHYAKDVWVKILGVIFPTEYETYTAGNLISWDNAPGGLRSFNSENDQGIEEVALPWKRKSFCFIPTVSALYLDTQDPFYIGFNLQNVKETVEEGQTSLRSYVGAMEESTQYWQDQYNQKHVTFDRRTANFLKSMLKKHRLMASDSPLTSRTFNFGALDLSEVDPDLVLPLATTKYIDFDLHISDEGQLWIHRDDRIAFTDVTSNPFIAGQEVYDVHVVPEFCTGDDVTVSLADGGLIRIGDSEEGYMGQMYFHPSTFLEVQSEGQVLLEEGYNNILSLQGGHMTIEEDGFVNAMWGSRIIVRDGSTLTVKTGGTLRLSQHSALEVEDGGTLVLEPGAIIQLWDGQEPGGQACIRIRDGGTLEWQGNPNFSGNGYFWFEAGSAFLALDDVQLTGMGKGFRFMRLGVNAHVQLESVHVAFEGGAIEYESGSGFYLDDGSLEATDMTFIGEQTADALALQAPASVAITGCTFEGVNGIYVNDYQGGIADFLVDDCEFGTCASGINASNSTFVTVKNSDFTHCDLAINLWENVSYFYGFNLDIRSVEPNEYGPVAIQLSDAPVFRLHQSTISRYEKGIYMIEPNTDENRSNVFLYNTNIQNCTEGITVKDGGTGPDRGLVLMDCCIALDNDYVIRGKDALLAIDATTNAAMHTDVGVTPNEFELIPYEGVFFQVCYKERDDIEQVLARENLWAGSGTNGAPEPYYDYFLKQAGSVSGNCILSSPNVPVILTPMASAGVIYCPEPPRMPEGPGSSGSGHFATAPDTSVHCVRITTSVPADTQLIHDAYIRGMHWFYWEDFDESFERLEPVASIPDTVRSGMSGRCRQYIDVARVMVDVLASLRSEPDPLIGDPTSDGPTSVEATSRPGNQEVYPNPARGTVTVKPAPGADRLRIVNALGHEMKEVRNPASSLSLDVGAWPDGVYGFISLSRTGRIMEVTRVVVYR